MTKKIFWEDPYLTELNTTVQTVCANQVTLKETIIYAFSGGQESDSGIIAGYPVLKAQKVEKEIFYTLPDNHPLKPGDKVNIVIDWDRRYKLMRLHFAAEIVLELVCQKFPEIVRIGAHIAQDKARIDFKWNQNMSSSLEELEQKAQEIVDSNQTVISDFSDKLTERRYWKIKELSQVPCGGTHIKNTAEIGSIRLKRANLGKGKERIQIYVN